MELYINGEPKKLRSRTVASLITELALDLRKLAIERNGVLVPRSLHETTTLAEGDRIEIVYFIGGG